jgi:adenylyltransferase/sulfurtransferase
VPTCAEGGVLGVLAGMVGTWQASEALKLVLGIGSSLNGRLLLLDALGARVREIALEVDPGCPLHGAHPSIFDVVPEPEEPEPAPAPAGVHPLAPAELDGFLSAHPGALVLDVREPHEAALGVAPHAVHIPAGVLEARLHELDSAREYVVACRVGAKSRWAAGRLHDAGFRRLWHLDGGLLAYAAAQPEFDVF